MDLEFSEYKNTKNISKEIAGTAGNKRSKEALATLSLNRISII